jgi:pimeloyl-ACP methyl ester carboxylesterase
MAATKRDKTPGALKFIRRLYPKVEKIAPAVAHRYFVKLFFTPLRYKIPEKERKAETYAAKFAVEVSGKKVQCYSWGTGSKIVLLVHGWAGRATQFRRFIKPLCAAGYRVIGFDGPAHGNSEGKTTDIDEFEMSLKYIYEKVGIPDAIIAHSFGGGVVLYAVMNGLPVKKLINIASPSIGDEIIKTYLHALRGSPKTGEFFKAYVLAKTGKQFDEFTALHFVRHLPKEIDLMLIHDENDSEVSIQQARAVQEAYPSTLLVETKGLGHTRILKDDVVIRKCVTYIDG